MSDERLVITCDDQGLITAVTGPLEAWFGHRSADVVGRSIVGYMHPRNQEISASLISTMAGKPYLEVQEDLRILTATDEWQWVDATVHGGSTGDQALTVTARLLAEPTSVHLERAHGPNDALLESEQRFRQIAAAAPIGMFRLDADLKGIYVNDRWQEITGIRQEDAVDGRWLSMVHPDDLAFTVAAWTRSREPGAGREHARLRMLRPDGELRWIDVGYASVAETDGTVTATVGTLEDVTDTVTAIQRSERLTHALEATPDLVAIWDAAEGTVYLNEAARQFLGRGALHPESTVGEFLPTELVDQWSRGQLPELIERGVWSGEIELPDRSGRRVPFSAVYLARFDDQRALVGVSAICRNISERKVLEARLAHQATHDPLTGLPNRVLLMDRLEVGIGRAERQGSLLAVLFLDLDRFKVVNDSLGHALGDRALAAVAGRLERSVRPGDTIARFGGDEFVVVAEDLADEHEAVVLANRLSAVAADPIAVDDQQFVLSVSIGVALTGRGPADAASLVRDADTAMYRAKARGGSRHQVFDARTRVEAVDRLALESDLRRAIEADELVLHHQPKVDLATGRIVGVETLVRWQHPTRGLLLPDQFLKIAVEAQLMVDAGAWIVDHAFAALPRMDAVRPPGSAPLFLCVNLSESELAHPGIVDTVADAASRHGVDPAHVDLELTEHTLMEAGPATQALNELSARGFKVAIDDFGTGYSSLAYLRHLPVDLLKIDQTFVSGLGLRAEDTAIVTAVLALARSLGMVVVAEGVETDRQLAELRTLGCDLAQGFHLARPLPEADLLALLADDPTY